MADQDVEVMPDVARGPLDRRLRHAPTLLHTIGAASEEVRDLAASTVSAAGRGHTPFGTYLLPGHHPAAELGRHVERTVFLEAFGNSAEFLTEEYRAYEAASLFACVIDHGRMQPVGAVRLILPSGAGHKSVEDIGSVWGQAPETVFARSGLDVDPGDVWDAATLAVLPGYRTGVVSLALYQATFTAAQACGAKWLVAVLDIAVLRLVQSVLRRPFARYDGVEARHYLGSPASVPCYIDIPAWSARLAATDPALHETVCLGRGLDAALSTPDWADLPDLVAELIAGPVAGLAPGRPPQATTPAAATSVSRMLPAGRS